jgi:hypothetical protein
MTNMMPIDVLETQAATQRKQLHNDVAELRSQIRERLQPKRLAREYMAPAAGVAGLVGLLLGYGVAGIFTRD